MELKLYGAAIAAVPSRDNPNILKVTCTPIEVSSENRKTFKAVDTLVYKARIDLSDSKQVFDAVGDISHTLGEVEKLQKASAEENGLPARPICLEIGHDGRHEANSNALYMQLFGKRHSEKIEDNVLAEMERLLRGPSGQPADPKHSGDIDALLAQITGKEDVVDVAAAARRQYLGQHGAPPDDFKQACASLSDMIADKDRVALQWGAFTRKEAAEHTVMPDNVRALFQELKTKYAAGDAQARDRLIQMAEVSGANFGKQNANYPPVFKMGSGIPGFAESDALKEQNPHLSFTEWGQAQGNTELADAFQRGFQKTFPFKDYNKQIKLPWEKDNPPFTDPLADEIRDQMEIALKQRDPTKYQDEPEWRRKLAEELATVAQSVPAPAPGDSDIDPRPRTPRRE